MNCTLQYPKKTPQEVREEMDRIEHADSKPLTSCQINGIDWEKRIANRQKRRERDMKKKADAYSDFFQDRLTSGGLNYLAHRTGLNRFVGDNIGGQISSGGSMVGLFSGKTPTLEELAEMEKNHNGWIPGNAARRTMLRRRMVNEKFKGNRGTIYSEEWGPGTSWLLTTLGTAGLGALAAGGLAAGHGRQDAPLLAGMGGIGGLMLGAVGSGAANLIGMARAGMTRPRTDKEQKEYEQAEDNWKNWVLPGRALYNKYKSLGVSNRLLRDYMDKQEREERKKKKEEEKDATMKKESGYFKLAKAASYIMCKRADSKEVLKQLQDQVAQNYISSLKTERDRSLKDDLLKGVVSGGLNGAQYGLLSGLLFGTTVAPAKDLIKGSDRTVLQSFGRGAGLGGVSGMGAGALIGAGVGALNNWATRDLRKQQAIKKLKELGITD